MQDTTIASTTEGEEWLHSTTEGKELLQSTTGGEELLQSTTGGEELLHSTTEGEELLHSTTGGEELLHSTTGGEEVVQSTTGGEELLQSTTGGEELLHSTTLPTCTRTCSCQSNQTLSNEELLVKIAKFKIEISVDRKNTSKYRKTKLSATDNRKSSRNLGILGIVVLVIPILLVVTNDLLTTLKYI
jgi:hypothetical protein